MDKEKIAELHRLIDDWASKIPSISFTSSSIPMDIEVKEERELPVGKRAVRTKSTGDRVYLVDEVAKTKAWITSPEILTKLGFELSDVEDVEDSTLLGYAMTASVYKVED